MVCDGFGPRVPKRLKRCLRGLGKIYKPSKLMPVGPDTLEILMETMVLHKHLDVIVKCRKLEKGMSCMFSFGPLLVE